MAEALARIYDDKDDKNVPIPIAAPAERNNAALDW
jgi:hypothetical protein